MGPYGFQPTLIQPVFIDKVLCDRAISATSKLIEDTPSLAHLFPLVDGRRDYHIAVLVGMRRTTPQWSYEKSLQEGMEPRIITGQSFGEVEKWKYPYKEIAENKVHQVWEGRQDGGTDIKPHLLFQSDTPYWGGEKRDNIATGCSGFECHADRLISSFVVNTIIALAYDKWKKSVECQEQQRSFFEFLEET